MTGPQLIMTDDSTAERAALENIYPKSQRLLCIFHVLQAFWRFLWDDSTGVPKHDRPPTLNLVKALVYADTEVQCAHHN